MRLVLSALTVLITGLVVAAAPSSACGCGGFAGDPVAIAEERALVVFDGERETITMRFGLASPAEPGGRSAWIMPVPAKPSLALANDDVFSRIDTTTGPERVTDKRYNLGFEPSRNDDEATATGDGAPSSGAGGGAPSGVDVLDRRRLGSYEISTLAADDRRALLDWLDENGYDLPPDLAEGIDFYIERGWLFTAAKVEADEAAGGLSPISVTFPAREPVYPVYLSRAADQPIDLRLDIAASGRVDVAGLGPVTRAPDREYDIDVNAAGPSPDTAPSAGAMIMRYSGAVPPPVRPAARGQAHLTSYHGVVVPDAIQDDPRLTVTRDRDEFRPKLIAVENVYLGEWVVAGVVVLLLAAGAGTVIVLRRRRARTS